MRGKSLLIFWLLLVPLVLETPGRKRTRRANKIHYLTTSEIHQKFKQALNQGVLVPTYDPFLDLLGVLAWGYSRDRRDLIVTHEAIRGMMNKIKTKTLFREFLAGFESIRLTRKKEIITQMIHPYVRFQIPKAFGAHISIASGFRLKVGRMKGNVTIIKVLTPEDIHFRLFGSRLSKLRGVVDLDIRRLTLFPKKNKKGVEELHAFLDGYVPLWPFGDPTPSKPARYKKYRIRVNLSTLGTFSGSKFVKGEYLKGKG